MLNTNTSSLGFAAYLQLKGYELSKPPEKVKKISSVTQSMVEKYNFTFDMSQTTMDTLYNNYVASEFYNFDSIVHQLKKGISKIKIRRNV